MTKTIFLARHCESEITDGKKGSLTEKGRRQATTLAQALTHTLGGASNVTLYSSPSERCIETAHIVGALLGTDVQIAQLRLKGADKLQIRKAQSKFSLYMESYKKLDIEPPEVFVERICAFLCTQPTENVILIGNEVPLRLLQNASLDTNKINYIPHGGCIKITLDSNKGTLI